MPLKYQIAHKFERRIKPKQRTHLSKTMIPRRRTSHFLRTFRRSENCCGSESASTNRTETPLAPVRSRPSFKRVQICAYCANCRTWRHACPALSKQQQASTPAVQYRTGDQQPSSTATTEGLAVTLQSCQLPYNERTLASVSVTCIGDVTNAAR